MLFVFILPSGPGYLKAAAPRPASISGSYQISRMISLSFKDEKDGTRVKIAGNDGISEYVTKGIDSPPRILVDIFTVVPTFETVTIPIKSRNLNSMRVGHHSTKIRLVLDIKGKEIPLFAVSSDRRGLTIFIKPNNPALPSMVLSPRQLSEQGTQTAKQVTMGNQGGAGSIADRRPGVHPEITLTRLEVDDGQDDTALFLEGLNKYKAQKWSDTIEKFNHFIKTYPSGRYTERAYFLLAKSYEHLYSDSISIHFKKIANHYEDAINNFPESIYVPGALLAVGDLCFKIKYYTEALGYYNLILKKNGNTPYALSAMKQKAKILHLKNRRAEALSVLEDLVSRNLDSHQKIEVEIEIAKILHELNAFRKSLDILSQLRAGNSQNIHIYPEISLYLGYNYEQLGDDVKARKNLFRFYNSCPDTEINHLILTKIGDTYRDEGLVGDAVKIYQLVRERYPDTEGARISAIRLAEQQEAGNLKTSKGISKPGEIYEDIINNPLDKNKKDPLTRLALLKLAVLYQKEKNFEKSLDILKKLFMEYPRTSLGKEAKRALQKTIELIFKEEMKRKRYISIINMYAREKELFSIIDSPEPFLIIARACIHLNFEGMATEMFNKADPFLQSKQKPPDLLFFLSRDLSEKDRPTDALTRLNLLIDNYPSGKYAQYAYRLKGDIFLRQKRYAQAAEMFSSALDYPLTRCEKTMLLIDKAGALVKCNSDEKALKAIREADSLKEACASHHDYIYQEIGDLYLNLGHPEEAAVIFNQAIDIAKEKPAKIPIKFKVAHCYWLLNKREDSIAVYDHISNLNDPFWSNFAKEKIEEINFTREIKEQITD